VNTWTMPIKNRTDMLSNRRAHDPCGQDLWPRPPDHPARRSGYRARARSAPGHGERLCRAVVRGALPGHPAGCGCLARYGLTTGDAQEVISLALGGEEITTTVEGRSAIPCRCVMPVTSGMTPARSAGYWWAAVTARRCRWGRWRNIQFSPGPPMIRSEGGYLYDQVSIDVRGRDVGSYVRDAQGVVAREVKLPTGYWLRWSGQYEAIQRVKARLQVVVPLTLGIIALLLYLTFGTVAEMAIVMLSLPFALVGGVWIMWLLDYNLSIAVAVGFIALAGVAAEPAS